MERHPPSQNIFLGSHVLTGGYLCPDNHAAVSEACAISADASAFDETGTQQIRKRSIALIAFPQDIDRHQDTAVYDISVAAGTTEIHIGRISAGPGYTIGSGQSEFHAYARIEFILEDKEGNTIVGTDASVDDNGSDNTESEDQ